MSRVCVYRKQVREVDWVNGASYKNERMCIARATTRVHRITPRRKLLQAAMIFRQFSHPAAAHVEQEAHMSCACVHPPPHTPRHHTSPWLAPTQQHTLADHLLAKNRVTGSSTTQNDAQTCIQKHITVHVHACMAMATVCTLVCVPRTPYLVARAPCCRGPGGPARHCRVARTRGFRRDLALHNVLSYCSRRTLYAGGPASSSINECCPALGHPHRPSYVHGPTIQKGGHGHITPRSSITTQSIYLVHPLDDKGTTA